MTIHILTGSEVTTGRPVGSFSESGTNICTTVLTIHKAERAREAA